MALTESQQLQFTHILAARHNYEFAVSTCGDHGFQDERKMFPADTKGQGGIKNDQLKINAAFILQIYKCEQGKVPDKGVLDLFKKSSRVRS
ncbi:hypothetical protein [Piscirickettsia litoralis]|uniref:Uncharacterized protein n=1 Tax=Piscirickettsia litoralis TaxID=1891921 RepID=A0ABX3A4S7_9GAMM|nr:hypothetical protein [Piscirickettsia litoralis]ODN43872.1 hypothetical protein BGC07_14470 [Piscirickettsia litoralis]